MADSIPPPGWYTSPTDADELRWWDGREWTTHVAGRPGVADAQTPAPNFTKGVSKPESTHREWTPTGPQGADSLNGQGAAESAISAVQVSQAVLEKAKSSGLFGNKALEAENAELRRSLGAIGATEREHLKSDIEMLSSQRDALRAQVTALEAEVIDTSDIAMLQEVGIYEYRHPLDSAVIYKDRLTHIQFLIKTMVKENGAVFGATDWHVNGSLQEGVRMVTELSKLMLRAYNNEADNAVRAMRPHALDSSIARLEKARSTISKLGRTMRLGITDAYHHLRIQELEITADYLAKVAEEKELERERRARLREEEKAQREFERETEKLQKEADHYSSVLAALRLSGDTAALADAKAKLAEIEGAMAGVIARAANTRAGYVYVISNQGSFGERMVKIGMTRRLEPMDRVRELGDASVPFRYDVHALVFSEDAVGLETNLHQALSDRKVNLINSQREFFYATPLEVRDLMAEYKGSLLSYEEAAEALEWRQSEHIRSAAATKGAVNPPASSGFPASMG